MSSEQAVLNFQWNNESEKADLIRLQRMFAIVNGANAEFGKDGDQWFYIVGSLPEPDCIVGFGKTPHEALVEFCNAFGAMV